MLEYHALGALIVTDGDGEKIAIGGPRQRRLMAALLIDRNSVVSVDRLTESVFAGDATAAAATTLRSYVARLRRVVDHNGENGEVDPEGRSILLTVSPGYMLKVPDESFDVGRFERMLATGRAAVDRDDAVTAASELRAALAMWHGEPYAEFADEDWVRVEAQRLQELRLVAYERLVDAELACGRTAETVSELEQLVVEHPLRDGFRERLMLALYRGGPAARCVALVPGTPSRTRRRARARPVSGTRRARTPNSRTRPDVAPRRTRRPAAARVPARGAARYRSPGHRVRGPAPGCGTGLGDPRVSRRRRRSARLRAHLRTGRATRRVDQSRGDRSDLRLLARARGCVLGDASYERRHAARSSATRASSSRGSDGAPGTHWRRPRSCRRRRRLSRPDRPGISSLRRARCPVPVRFHDWQHGARPRSRRSRFRGARRRVPD